MPDNINEPISRAWIVQADNDGPKMFMLEPDPPNFDTETLAAPGASIPRPLD